MFRRRHCNPLIPLLFLLAICFMNCDGRHRKHRDNSAILANSKPLNIFSNQLSFVPNQSVEIETDTLLNNGFRVKLNYYSKGNYIGTNTNKSFHYNFEANVQVLLNDQNINTSVINKTLFKNFETSSFFRKGHYAICLD